MNYKRCLGGLAAALLGLGSSLFGQSPAPVIATTPATLPSPEMADGSVPGGGAAAIPPGVSSWLAYPRPASCCGPVGGNGPVFGEFYERTGVSVPLGTSRFTTDMNPGLTFNLGFRSLFFNPTLDSAWVVDFGLGSTWNSLTDAGAFTLRNVPVVVGNNGLNGSTGSISTGIGNGPAGTNTDPVVTTGQLGQTVNVPAVNLVPIRVHQTTLNLSIGKEYYLWGTACCDGTSKCRAGWDVGGRYGSGRIDFAVFRHLTDTIGGAFLAVHTDYETPIGCCLFHAGVRLEYGYQFTDFLQRQNDSDIQSINALITIGARF